VAHPPQVLVCSPTAVVKRFDTVRDHFATVGLLGDSSTFLRLTPPYLAGERAGFATVAFHSSTHLLSIGSTY